jgi:hypothetical protein
MPFLLNGVDVKDLRVNGTQVDRAYLNGVEVYERIGVGTILEDGGIIFAQEGGDWLVVAPASLRQTKAWGLRGIDTSLPNWTYGNNTTITPTDPNSSKYNTDVLTSSTYKLINDGYGNLGSPAAEYCRSVGYDLPNARDLGLISNNRSQIEALDTTGNLPASGNVWASTEYDSESAWVHHFGDGKWYRYYGRSGSAMVIPFKRIPV